MLRSTSSQNANDLLSLEFDVLTDNIVFNFFNTLLVNFFLK